MSAESIEAMEISTLLGASYPPAFLQAYDLIECLAAGHGTETYLVRRKGSDEDSIAKCYDRGVYSAVQEGSILKSLRHDGLPQFLDEYRDEKVACVVRRYVEGTPLDQYMAYDAPSTAKILRLCAQLLDILIYLHGRERPVIHRDIKPSNIIVTPGGVTLIDFDIARMHHPEAEVDTRLLGTRSYAPPEQYGFSQTDCRADIYSFGVVLCWMLTGQVNARDAKIANAALGAVVRKCTAFSPEDRYKSAAEVKRALLNADGHRRRAALSILGIAAAMLLCLFAGFSVGRYTGFFAQPVFGGVRFQEPLIEQAVRVQLGIGADERITAADLASVQEIYIFGDEVAASGEGFASGLSGARKFLPRGAIASLEDVRMLPNLRTLYVNHQALSDISPLSALEQLTVVNLRHTRVSDVSALSGMKLLEDVNLFDTLVTDASDLDACPRLKSLEMGHTLIVSPEGAGGRQSVRNLSLKDMSLTSLTGIERFHRLEALDLSGIGLPDLTPLKALPNLKRVALDGSMRDTARVLGLVPFEIDYGGED